MEVVVERISALDVHKDSVVAGVRTPGERAGSRRQEVRTFGTFAADLARLGDWLVSEGVTLVVMEATGVYWRPVWYALEGRIEQLMLVNAMHVKKVPGRKTDVKDAEWLAQLGECGLLHGSFVPPEPIRDLRDLTRYRKRLVQDRAREVLRVQKVLEDGGIKLASLAADVLGRSGRDMLEALIAGERDPNVLADLARMRMRRKIPQLRQALDTIRFREHHAHMLGTHLAHIDYLEKAIAQIDEQVEVVIAPFAEARQQLMSIPGVGRLAANCVIAEIGVDMSVFPSAEHLASWAGMCPGNRRSAGKNRTGRTPQGDPWLSSMLTQCAWVLSRSRGTYLGAQFWRIARRRGQERAAVAVGHSILVIAWHLLSKPGSTYQDLGGDYFTRRLDPQRQQRRLIAQLQALGLTVEVTPTPAAA